MPQHAGVLVRKAGELGGMVTAGPMDFPGGRFAVVLDDKGAAFGLPRTMGAG